MATNRTVWVVRVVSKLTAFVVAKYIFAFEKEAREAHESVKAIRIDQNHENVNVTLTKETDPLY